MTQSLGGVSQFIVDETTGQITGYKTEVGADTVFPFSSVIYLKNAPCEEIGTKSSSGYYPQLDIDISSLYQNYASIEPKEVFINKTFASSEINWSTSIPTMSYNKNTGVISLSVSNDRGVLNVPSVNVAIVI